MSSLYSLDLLRQKQKNLDIISDMAKYHDYQITQIDKEFKIELRNGLVYNGKILNGVPHGKGSISSVNCFSNISTWNNGEIKGFVTFNLIHEEVEKIDIFIIKSIFFYDLESIE